MSEFPHGASFFTQVDISAGSTSPSGADAKQERGDSEQVRLLREILVAQDKQTELLEELVGQLTAAVSQWTGAQRQRNQELQAWKDANPKLARNCRKAAEALSRVQTEFLNTLTDEVNTNGDGFTEGEFLMNEFVDRFGPRLAHLNGVLQVLAQLSAGTPPQQQG